MVSSSAVVEGGILLDRLLRRPQRRLALLQAVRHVVERALEQSDLVAAAVSARACRSPGAELHRRAARRSSGRATRPRSARAPQRTSAAVTPRPMIARDGDRRAASSWSSSLSSAASSCAVSAAACSRRCRHALAAGLASPSRARPRRPRAPARCRADVAAAVLQDAVASASARRLRRAAHRLAELGDRGVEGGRPPPRGAGRRRCRRAGSRGCWSDISSTRSARTRRRPRWPARPRGRRARVVQAVSATSSATSVIATTASDRDAEHRDASREPGRPLRRGAPLAHVA